MNTNQFLIAFLTTLLSPCFLIATTGREILDEQERRHHVESEETRLQMSLIDRRGREREREMVMYVLKGADGLNKTLIKFTSPTDIRNVGLLTWQQGEDKEDDQWLHLPSSNQVKRIAGSGKKNSFMGTDIAFEDLRPENLDAHDYNLLRKESIDGHDHWVVEAIPSTEKEKKDSGYSKRVFWIRKDIYFTVKTEFYNRRGRLAKLALNEELINLQGDIWRSNVSTTERLAEKTKTVLRNQYRAHNIEMSKSFFTQQNLRRPAKVN